MCRCILDDDDDDDDDVDDDDGDDDDDDDVTYMLWKPVQSAPSKM